jgi:phage tail sheath protein FI
VLASTGAEAAKLEDNYTSASIDSCPIGGDDVTAAANEAEAFMYSYRYDAPLELAVKGNKNSFQFVCESPEAYSQLTAGDLIKIEQTGRHTTREIRIKDVKPPIDGEVTVLLETSNVTEIGYQALPLQDNYDDGRISKVTKVGGVPQTVLCCHLLAASAGTWANSDGVRTGLIVTVSPGSKPDTKKILVYEDSGLVETIDNLSDDPESEDYYVTRIQGRSQYITIPANFSVVEHPANTVNPWNRAAATVVNIMAFEKGANGLTPQVEDFVGTINPADDSQTGLKVFEDENLTIDVLVAPDVSTLFPSNDMAVAQEMARIARRIFAVGLIDVPRGLNAREAIDWHNGEGLWSYRHGKLDTYNLACSWNWLTITDVFTGEQKVVPPTLGVLRCLASTFDRYKPWFAAAGEIRGAIPEATAVEFTKVPLETRAAMYGDGNSVNPILLMRGRILNFGERTLQRAESKLTALHSVILTNYIVRGLSELGRRFVFDPNDNQLLDEMRVAFTGFLDAVQNERGVEEYRLVLDESNNTAETRNRREVIVDLSFIPVDAVERIYINATVRESGAELNTVR